MTRQEAIGIWLPLVLMAVHDSPQCEEAVKMAGRALEQEPKTGHWIYDSERYNWVCSECGETPKTMGYVGLANFMEEHFKWCNHCGARMEGAEE